MHHMYTQQISNYKVSESYEAKSTENVLQINAIKRAPNTDLK